MISRLFIVFLAAVLALPAYAASAIRVPTPSTRIGNTTADLIEMKARQRGFAANDPRIAATVATVASVAVGGVVATTTAPLWVTAAVAAGVGLIVTSAVQGLLDWVFNEDGTITVPPTQMYSGFPTADAEAATYWSKFASVTAVIQACRYPNFNQDLRQCYSASVTAATPQAAAHGAASSVNGHVAGPGGSTTTYEGRLNDTNPTYYPEFFNPTFLIQLNGNFDNNPALEACSGYMRDGVCVPLGGGRMSPAEAIDSISEPDYFAPLPAAVVAAQANEWWRKASALPGYDGIPYDNTRPVTPSDVEAYRALNPNRYPSTRDMVSPIPSPSANSAPGTSPSASTFPRTSTGAALDPMPSVDTPATSTVKVDLGLDPGISAPALEPVTSGEVILSPLLNLFPGLRDYAVPAHSAECPQPTFTAFGRTYTVSSHCYFLDEQRAFLQTVSVASFTILAVLTVLSA